MYLQHGGGVTQDLESRESSTRVDANPNILRACRNLRQALFTYQGVSENDSYWNLEY